MATIKRFEDLEIWKMALVQTEEFYKLMMSSNLRNDFSLKDQMNSSSGSVMDNIAEGFERSGNKEFKQFLIIAKGSNGEYRSQLFRCLSRNYLKKDQFDYLYEANLVIGNKIMTLISYLQNSEYLGESRKPKPPSNYQP